MPNGTLLFSAAAALAYLLIVTWPPSPRRTAAKTLSTALLSLLAVLQGGPALLVAALALGALGDAFLAQNGDRAFLGGLASFLAAHLAYVALFWMDGEGFLGLTQHVWPIAAALALIIFSGFMAFRLMPAVEKSLMAPVAIYIAAILSMGLTALTVDRPLVILGAVMFIISDTCLATEKFLLSQSSVHRHWSPYAVWSLYYSGQLAIALGFLT